jgi:exopolysaccharide biosynthesis WecB/TagA/CpsF family protein
MTIPTVPFMGLSLRLAGNAEPLYQAIGQKETCVQAGFIHPGTWPLAAHNTVYKDAITQMAMVFSESMAVSGVYQLANQRPCQRVSFDIPDISGRFFKTVAERHAGLMLIGGEPAIEDRMAMALRHHLPDLKIVGNAHGFGDFTPKIEAVLQKVPDVVLVSMPSPRQETFMMALCAAGYKGLVVGCGDFFEHYLKPGNSIYPAWVQKYHLRFAYRLYQNPGREWRVYLLDYPLFFIKAIRTWLQKHPDDEKTAA